MAGIIGKLGPAIPVDPSPPPVLREPLPTDIAALTARVEMLELQNRLEREKSTLIDRRIGRDQGRTRRS